MITKTAAIAGAVVLGAVCVGAAAGKDNPHEQPVNPPGQLTRAQVQADLRAYQASGLAALRDIETYGYDQPGVERAQARYAALRGAPPAPPPLSRAEVLADLQIYMESGLAAVDRSETYGYNQAAIAQAQARYLELRQSAYYATLVRRYGGGTAKVDAGPVTAR